MNTSLVDVAEMSSALNQAEHGSDLQFYPEHLQEHTHQQFLKGDSPLSQIHTKYKSELRFTYIMSIYIVEKWHNKVYFKILKPRTRLNSSPGNQHDASFYSFR